MNGVSNVHLTKANYSGGRVLREGRVDREEKQKEHILKKQSARDTHQTMEILLGWCVSNLNVQAIT